MQLTLRCCGLRGSVKQRITAAVAGRKRTGRREHVSSSRQVFSVFPTFHGMVQRTFAVLPYNLLTIVHIHGIAFSRYAR